MIWSVIDELRDIHRYAVQTGNIDCVRSSTGAFYSILNSTLKSNKILHFLICVEAIEREFNWLFDHYDGGEFKTSTSSIQFMTHLMNISESVSRRYDDDELLRGRFEDFIVSLQNIFIVAAFTGDAALIRQGNETLSRMSDSFEKNGYSSQSRAIGGVQFRYFAYVASQVVEGMLDENEWSNIFTTHLICGSVSLHTPEVPFIRYQWLLEDAPPFGPIGSLFPKTRLRKLYQQLEPTSYKIEQWFFLVWYFGAPFGSNVPIPAGFNLNHKSLINDTSPI